MGERDLRTAAGWGNFFVLAKWRDPIRGGGVWIFWLIFGDHFCDFIEQITFLRTVGYMLKLRV